MDDVKNMFSEEEIRGYEKMPIPIGVFQKKKGNFELLLVSDGMCRLLENTREEILRFWNQDRDRGIHPEDKKAIEESIAYIRLHPQSDVSLICRLKTKEAGYVLVACNGKEKMAG